MEQKIRQLCQDIEKQHNIRILFAVENGSRAWRMESEDSDYDVRFVFIRPLTDYIQIGQPADVINVMFDKDGNTVKSNAVIDMSGFDIFKFARLLASSNPTTIEWLMSDIVYYGKQNKVLKKFAEDHFNPIALYFHYKSLCRNNYIKYIKSGQHVTYKKYLYAYRGLVNAKYVVHKNKVPPIIFSHAIAELKQVLPGYISDKLDQIIRLKSQGREKEIIQNIVKMDTYIDKFLKDDSEAPKTREKPGIDTINCELRRLLL